MRLFPKNFDFFKLFEEQSEELMKAAKVFMQIEKNSDMRKLSEKIKKIEHAADDITHQVISELNQTFITPIDREDIALLVSRMDDIADEIDRAINRIWIYDIKPTPPQILEYGKLIKKSVEEINKCIIHLRTGKKHKEVLKYCESINEIENEADELHRATVRDLFRKNKNPIKIMKLREIYEYLENVTDRSEDVANILETIVVKNM